MAGRAYCAPEGRYVETSNPRDREVVLRYRGAPRGTFRCEVNDGPMYAQVRHGVAVLCHWPDTAHDGCRLAFGMTDEHRRQQEYWAEAGSRAGWSADTEVSTGNGTRLDVAISGLVRVGIEVQHSGITPRAVKARTTKSYRAGWTSLWSSDSEQRPKWVDTVPTLRAAANWAERPPQGTATAIGPRTVSVGRCEPGQLGPGCKRPCRRLHRPYFELIRGLTVDDVAARMPAGDLVPLQYRPGYIYLTPPDDLARYVEMTGRDAAWTPGSFNERRSREARRGIDATCQSGKHDSVPVAGPAESNSHQVQSEFTRFLATEGPSRRRFSANRLAYQFDPPSAPPGQCHRWLDEHREWCGARPIGQWVIGPLCERHAPIESE